MSPIVKQLYTTTPAPRITTDPGNKALIYIILSLFTIITAPVMFIVWLVPKFSDIFKNTLLVELKKS